MERDTTRNKLRFLFRTKGANLASLAFVDNVLYLASGDGFLYALRATNGSLLWKYGVGSAIYSSPVVSNGIVYFGAENGKIYAIK